MRAANRNDARGVPAGAAEYELPQREYAFVQEVGARLGAIVKNEVVCVLGRQIKRLYSASADEERIVRQLAAAHGVPFPE